VVRKGEHLLQQLQQLACGIHTEVVLEAVTWIPYFNSGNTMASSISSVVVAELIPFHHLIKCFCVHVIASTWYDYKKIVIIVSLNDH